MAKRIIVILVLFVFILSSCDPGIALTIANRTNTDKKVKVLYPANFKFPGDVPHSFGIRDSVSIYNQSIPNNYQHSFTVPRVNWDTIARTYEFNLMANYAAVIESRFLATDPTYGQIFIIDNKDTLELKRRGKIFIKKPKLTLGGTWTYTITDKKQ